MAQSARAVASVGRGGLRRGSHHSTRLSADEQGGGAHRRRSAQHQAECRARHGDGVHAPGPVSGAGATAKEEQLDFARVTTFNLDEYVGLTANHPQSYHYFMHEHFFQHVNIPRQNINIPSGTTSNYPAFCKWYEQRITECGGIDLQILGIGSDGHIAFNEPTSSLSSRTRLKTLSKQTIDDNARFFERREDVPVYAITMGVGTILD